MGSLSAASVASAQIVPDGTLPTNSAVTIDGNTFTLDGGTAAGVNLFHSFQEFSVPTGTQAFFNNSSTIDNIITRVTGGQVSNIDGLIRANGTADLFLINPSGIVFGANAKLDIGGSFIGSTADSIQFDDGSIFSATNPNAPPLLTVNVPVGLQYGANPGDIRVRGSGHDINQPQVSPHNRGQIGGLQVQPGNTLALIGGNVILEGGTLTAESGRIEIGSVADGQVSLSPILTGWTLGYEGIQNFRDIQLLSKSAVDVSGAPGGDIFLRGQNLELRDGSIALIQNQGSQKAGNINVNLSDSLIAVGIDPDGAPASSLVNETVGAGDTGDLTISARRLVFQNGGQAGTRTFGSGNSGNVTANVSDSASISGFTLDPNGNPFISNILTVSVGSSGAAGNIMLFVKQLRVLEGGQVLSTVVFGSGKGGDVVINATDSVEVSGFTPTFSGSLLAATTFGAGNSGNVTVNTGRLVLRDGGRVDANTIASGNAGNVTVNASESVEIIGTVRSSQITTPSQVGSAANTPDPALQQFLGLPPIPSGSPGNVTINTPELRVSDGALVTVKNDGVGNAGNLSIQTDSLFLDNGGGITASTASGEGGNLTLQIGNTLQLRNGSEITSEAGGTGNGGNITLSTSTLALLQGSRINANAFEGAGGNISIETQGIFVSPDSAITASSQLGVDGIVQVTNPVVDPASGLLDLPQNVTDPSDRIVSGCAAEEGSSFATTGRGGLPEDPTSAIRGQILLSDFRDFSTPDTQEALPTTQNRSTETPQHSPAIEMVKEATGWRVNPQGKVELVAEGANTLSVSLNCEDLR
jgi:filamentous hemagglutinin family protein